MLPSFSSRVAVVVPAYKVGRHIREVVNTIPVWVETIYVVDDACPEGSGKLAQELNNPRVQVIFQTHNQGVGAATIAGMVAAFAHGHEICAKLDGDGQMNPDELHKLIRPIDTAAADYTKGNRFYKLEYLEQMPRLRLIGNAALSLITKFSSGYWQVMDPTNGYFAISAEIFSDLPLNKLEPRYFFESDMLFRLSAQRAVVLDVPMPARYADEKSNLRIGQVLLTFPAKHLARFCKRILYTYFLREWNVGTILLTSGLCSVLGGLGFGIYSWHTAAGAGMFSSSGTVMLAALPVLVGVQFLLNWVIFDVNNTPKRNNA